MLHVALSEVSAKQCFENFHFFACLVWSQTFMKLFFFPLQLSTVIMKTFSIFILKYLLKKHRRPKMVPLVLKPVIPNVDGTSPLITVLTSQNCNLDQLVWNFLVSTESVMWALYISHRNKVQAADKNICCFLPPKRWFLLKRILSFLLLKQAPLPHPSSYKKTRKTEEKPSIYTTPWSTLLVTTLDDAAGFMNHLDLQIYWVEFCFFNILII